VEKSCRVGSSPSFPPAHQLTTPISLPIHGQIPCPLHRVALLYVSRFHIILGQILELSVNWIRSLHLSHELSLITDAIYSITIWKLGRTMCVYSMVQGREKKKDSRYIQKASAFAAMTVYQTCNIMHREK